MSGGKIKRQRREAAVHRELAAATAQVKAERDAAWKRAEAEADRERERVRALPPIDPARMSRGSLVGDRKGRVGEVLRVNAKTVTVRCGVIESRLALADVIAIKEAQP